MLKAVAPLAMLLMVILLASAPSAEAFGSASHPFILQWGQSGLTEPGTFYKSTNIAIDSER